MVPTPRANVGHSPRNSSKPWLEIIPDERFIVFHGGEHEANDVTLRGVVRLHTPEAMSITKPKIRLEGKRKISWWYMGGITTSEITDKRVFWNQEQKLGGVESAHKVKAGTIEWPFEFTLSPSMPESVEGLRETYIAYHIHASVSRPGWQARDILAQEHIRLVRTLGQDTMEMTRSRVNADIWANKISYSISIPTDAVVFGTSITADVELSPLKKGIRLGKVELRMVETVVKRIQASEVPDIRGDRSKTEEGEVAKAEMDFPEDSRVLYDGETVDNPTMADEMYKFRAQLTLPKSLNVCRQDVDTHNINITHRFKLMVNIHNPEGHVSQLVCRLPVKLFISPNLPVDEQNEVSSSPNRMSDTELNTTETAVVAPPEYGRHQLDQIYSDIDPSGFMSRAGSGSATPWAQSRRGSSDNVLSMNGIAQGEPAASHGSAMPHLLHSRLADLQESGPSHGVRFQGVSRHHSPSGGNSPAPGPSESTETHSPDHSSSTPLTGSYRNTTSYFPSTSLSSRSPHSTSVPMSRQPSTDHDTALHAQAYDLTDLSRVPSYGAALRTPGAMTPFTEGPPSYVDATSRPPSPQRPGQAHVRTNGSPSLTSVQQQQNSLMGQVGDLRLAAAMARPQYQSLHQHDDESRLRSLRART